MVLEGTKLKTFYLLLDCPVSELYVVQGIKCCFRFLKGDKYYWKVWPNMLLCVLRAGHEISGFSYELFFVLFVD